MDTVLNSTQQTQSTVFCRAAWAVQLCKRSATKTPGEQHKFENTEWDFSFSLYQRFCRLLPTWIILQSVLHLATSLKGKTPVTPLHRGMGEQDTPAETLSVMCTEAGSFVGDLITVLRTKFHVMDGLKKGHTSLIIEFWLSLRLAF